jgi:hypothetical protein
MILAVALFAYTYPIDRAIDYSMTVELSGDLPLVKPTKGTASLKIDFRVTGLSAAGANPKVLHELTAFASSLNGTKLPFGLENVKTFFPKTTVEFEPSGKVIKHDSPVKSIPTPMSGFDPARFPEFTYLPIIFPAGFSGKPWQFAQPFSGQIVNFEAKVESETAERLIVSVTMKQDSTTFEDSNFKAVSTRAEAAFVVKTALTGDGTIVFDRRTGTLANSKISAIARSAVFGILGRYSGARELRTALSVEQKVPPR